MVPRTNDKAPSPTKIANASNAVSGRPRVGVRHAIWPRILWSGGWYRPGMLDLPPDVAAVLEAPPELVEPGQRSIT